MPKKMTKAQVKRRVKTISDSMYIMFNDKVKYGSDSHVQQSWKALAEAHGKWVSSWRRL